MKTIWKNRAAIALVVMGIVCFVVAVQAQSFRAFAVVFVLGLLLIARPFKQTVIDNLGKWIRERLGILSLLLVGGCATTPVKLSDMHMVASGSKVEYFAESAPNQLGHRTRKRIAHIEKLPRAFSYGQIRKWGESAYKQKAPAWAVQTVVEVNGKKSGRHYFDR